MGCAQYVVGTAFLSPCVPMQPVALSHAPGHYTHCTSSQHSLRLTALTHSTQSLHAHVAFAALTHSITAHSLTHCVLTRSLHSLPRCTHSLHQHTRCTHSHCTHPITQSHLHEPLTHSLTHSLTQAGRARRAPWSALLPIMLQQPVRRNSTHTSGLVVEFSQTARDASRRECECFSWQRDGGVQNRALCRQSSWHSGATARQRLHDVVGQCILG